MASATDYTLTEAIHESATTVIYRGVRNLDKLPVIIKRLKSALPTPAEIARLKYEYAITRDLSLPGVAKIYGVETIGNNLALIIESRGGQALSEVLAARALNTREVLSLAIAIAGTLETVHRSGIVHMDIKPHNIIVDMATLEAKLTDFGSATRTSQEARKLKSPAALEGTLAYVSPEQTGRMNYAIDLRTDLYSFGVSLYEMATGRLPFPTTDFMDLVHSHIARLPTPPHELVRGTPKVLSDIILRLLAKSPDDRYQTAHGLKADLSECLQRLSARGTIDPFPLGRHDFVDKLRIPQKLYGRETELAVVRDVWRRASDGAAGLLLVSGYSGVGKTALVQEIHQTIARGAGYFVSGKFDQLSRATPYAAVSQALRELMRTILTEPAESLAGWKSRLHDAVGANGQLVVDLVPELGLILGPQDSVPSLGHAEAQNRFNLTLQNFIRALPSPQRPLVLFLDDLQWADPASLRLIHVLLTEQSLRHALVIGAYRDNEVDETHLFSLTLTELRKDQANLEELLLTPLDAATVGRLVADTLGCSDERAAPLTAFVFAKTRGNPFFMGQLLTTLHTTRLLSFDVDAHAWTWDMAEILRTKVTDNVIEFMTEKIAQLPADARQLLTLAACVGHSFDLHTLATIGKRSRQDTAAGLWDALRAGLVVPLDAESRFFEASLGESMTAAANDLGPALNAGYRFLHDRVQQAAYATIPADRREALHLEIGRLLQTCSDRDGSDAELFEIAGHFGRGAALIQDPEERLALARLSLAAGQRASAGAAHDAAVRYLGCGLAMLPAQAWRDEYALTLALHTEMASANSLSGDAEAAQRQFDAALAHTRDDVDRARVLGACLSFHMSFGKLAEAVKSGLAAISSLGLTIPESVEDRAAALAQGLETLRASLAERTIADLLALPVVTDPAQQTAIAILAELASVSIVVEPTLGMLLIVTLLNYSIEHGNAGGSAYGYALHAVLCMSGVPNYGGTEDPYREAYAFSKLSTELNERLRDTRLTCKLLAMFAAILHFFEPLPVVLKALERVRRVGFETGDLTFAAYSCVHLIATKMARGDELDALDEEVDATLKLTERTNERMTALILTGAKQAIAALKGLTAARDSLGDAAFDEPGFLAAGKATGATVVGWYYTIKQQLHYLHGDYASAEALLATTEQVIAGWSSHYFTTDVTFYACLTHAALCDGAAPEVVERRLADIARRLVELSHWAELGPANYAHKHLLVLAEVARVTGRVEAAEALYDQAIDAASAHGFGRDVAMASEICARFYLARGRARTARAYMTDAYHGYLHWGATAKMDDLMTRWPDLITQGVTLPWARDVRARASSPRRQTSSTTNLGANLLDVEAVIRSAQTIAGEVVLDKVVAQLMDVVLKSAGAGKGVLILERERRLIVEAAVDVDPNAPAVTTGVPIEASTSLPLSVVQYVARTGEPVLSDDLTKEPRFAADPYVAAHQPRSILCLSLTHQGRATGMLYLENSVASNAFTPAQLELLKLLLVQAATAVENALLYKHVQDRTEALYRMEEQLKVEFAERERSEQARVALQEEIIRVQNARLAELSTPIIPITDRIMVMPLIGTMDAQRAQEVLSTALQGVQANRAEVVIVDITGVNLVDSDVASTLLRTASALRLLGAQAVLTGIRPEVAQTLVNLQIDFGALVTRGTLQAAIAYALERTGNTLTGTPSGKLAVR